MTLAEFTAARLDEDERIARETIASEPDGTCGCPPGDWSYLDTIGSPDYGTVYHVMRHDPARVLREVAAKRKILARHAPHRTASGGLACDWCSEDTDDRPQLAKVSWPCGDVRDIAAIWSDHPGYDPSWERE